MVKDDGVFEGMTQEEIEKALQDDEYLRFDNDDKSSGGDRESDSD